MLEYQRWADTQCSGCGQSLAESIDPDLEGAYDVAAIVCHACAARDRTSKKHRDVDGLRLAVSLSAQAREFLDGKGG